MRCSRRSKTAKRPRLRKANETKQAQACAIKLIRIIMEAREGIGSAVIDEAETEKKVYKITFLRRDAEPVTVEYEPGVTPYHEHGREGSLLDIALNYGIDLEHACGGNCACTTCHVVVKAGEENLTQMDEDEEDRL